MQVAEITREETAERAMLLRVRSYDIELDLTGGAETALAFPSHSGAPGMRGPVPVPGR